MFESCTLATGERLAIQLGADSYGNVDLQVEMIGERDEVTDTRRQWFVEDVVATLQAYGYPATPAVRRFIQSIAQ